MSRSSEMPRLMAIQDRAPHGGDLPCMKRSSENLSSLDGVDLLVPLLKHEFRGSIALVSSFGAESAVLLHMIAGIDRSLPVITLDTGKLFRESVAYRSQLARLLGLDRHPHRQARGRSVRLLDADGLLHEHDPDACCRIRKVEPLNAGAHGVPRLDFRAQALPRRSTRERPDPRGAGRAAEDRAAGPFHRTGHRGLSRSPRSCPVTRSSIWATARSAARLVPLSGGSADNPRVGRWPGRAKNRMRDPLVAQRRPTPIGRFR